MAAVTDPPACPFCRAQAGDRWCYTATNFRRHWHAMRWALVDAAKAAAPAPAPAPARKPKPKRASEAQYRILCRAMTDGGLYELSGYRFHGDAQRRAAMRAMVEKQWFRYVRETQHGSLHELTNDGRNAFYAYEEWMRSKR